MSYRIIRKYQNDRPDRVIELGLTLEEARAHCERDDTSSMTAPQPQGCNGNTETQAKWYERGKHWFDVFAS